MKHVIVLGGGFAGVNAVLQLEKKISSEVGRITLIDEKDYLLFTPSLYEVATSEEPQKNVVIPYKEIFSPHVQLIKRRLEKIDPENNTLFLEENQTYIYDYLLIALGSETAYYDIPGLKKYSFPLKKLSDATSIRNAIREKYHENIKKDKPTRIVIGGGGFSGTELAAEMIEYRKHLAKHHMKNIDLAEIHVIQGSDRLLNELDPSISRIARNRMTQEGVMLHFGSHIKKVDAAIITTENGETFSYDVLVWTGGVRANHVVEQSGFTVNQHGQVAVNEFLQVEGHRHIFAAGDMAEYKDPRTNAPIPGIAFVAETQGRKAGKNIAQLFHGKQLEKYHYQYIGYIVPLRGHFASAMLFHVRIIGFIGWIIQQLVHLYYLLSILPLNKALRRWNTFEKDLDC